MSSLFNHPENKGYQNYNLKYILIFISINFWNKKRKIKLYQGGKNREAANCLKHSNEEIKVILFIPEMVCWLPIYFSLFLSMPKSEGQIFNNNLHVNILNALRWIVINILQNHCECSSCGMHSFIVISSKM